MYCVAYMISYYQFIVLLNARYMYTHTEYLHVHVPVVCGLVVALISLLIIFKTKSFC